MKALSIGKHVGHRTYTARWTTASSARLAQESAQRHLQVADRTWDLRGLSKTGVGFNLAVWGADCSPGVILWFLSIMTSPSATDQMDSRH